MDYRGRLYPNRLQLFRRSMGLEQRQVARKLGLNNPASLSYWENAKQIPSSTNLIKLCIIYAATPQELYPEYYQFLIGTLDQ